MQHRSSEALILDVFDLHDGDRIVVFLTREFGKKRGVAPGAKRKYSRFSGQLQPLAKVSVNWFEKEGRDLVRISDLALERPAHRLQEDLDDILLGAYLAESLVEIVQDEEPGELYFRLLDSALEGLLAGVDRDLTARWFELWLLQLAGTLPSVRECSACGRRLGVQGVGPAVLPTEADAFLCLECADSSQPTGGGRRGEIADNQALAFLDAAMRQSLTTLANQPVAATVLRRSESLAGRMRRSFLGKELKSYKMLAETQRALARDSGKPASKEPDPVPVSSSGEGLAGGLDAATAKDPGPEATDGEASDRPEPELDRPDPTSTSTSTSTSTARPKHDA